MKQPMLLLCATNIVMRIYFFFKYSLTQTFQFKGKTT